MNSRSNLVILSGTVQLARLRHASQGLILEMTISTSLQVLGGRHHVVCQGDLALEVLAFGVTAWSRKELLTATVHGWLWSSSERAFVVGKDVAFHAHPDVRQQAVGVLKQLRQLALRQLPERLVVNGRAVDLNHVLRFEV